MPRNDGNKHWGKDDDAPKHTRGAKLKRRKRIGVQKDLLRRLKRKRKKTKGEAERIASMEEALKGTGLE